MCPNRLSDSPSFRPRKRSSGRHKPNSTSSFNLWRTSDRLGSIHHLSSASYTYNECYALRSFNAHPLNNLNTKPMYKSLLSPFSTDLLGVWIRKDMTALHKDYMLRHCLQVATRSSCETANDTITDPNVQPCSTFPSSPLNVKETELTQCRSSAEKHEST